VNGGVGTIRSSPPCACTYIPRTQVLFDCYSSISNLSFRLFVPPATPPGTAQMFNTFDYVRLVVPPHQLLNTHTTILFVQNGYRTRWYPKIAEAWPILPGDTFALRVRPGRCSVSRKITRCGGRGHWCQDEEFPTVISPFLYLLKPQYDGDEGSHVLVIRYFYYPPLGVLPNRLVPFFTAVAIGLLAKRVWDRCLAKTKKRSPESASPEPSIARSSPTTRFPLGWNLTSSSEGRGSGFPQEVADMIAAHLIDDTCSLLACSLTSRSWYLAAVPHIHRTLITQISYSDKSKKTEWPRPLQVGGGPFGRPAPRLTLTEQHST
jgi:hypothetical protein